MYMHEAGRSHLMHYCSNGVRLYYETVGSGKPLVLIHGNGEDHTIFDQAVRVLSRRYTCYLPDSRGHGASDRVEELHYKDMADDLICFLETLDLKETAVYGFSDGGIIGLLAAMRTERITRLAVSGVNCTPQGVVSSLRAMIAFLHALKPDPKLRLMLEEPWITSDELGTVQAETLILAGSEDAVRKQETELIHASVPRSEMRILAGETHGSYIVHNRKIGDILFAWLSRTHY